MSANLDLLKFSIALVASAAAFTYFSLVKLALTRSRSSKLKELIEAKALGATIAKDVLKNVETYFVVTYLGLSLSVLLGGFATHALSALFFTGVWRPVFSASVMLLQAFGALLVLQLLKAVTLSRIEVYLCWSAFPLIVFKNISYPLVFVLNRVVNRVASSLGVVIPSERDIVVSAEELSEIVEVSSKAGEIEEDEREMIQGVFGFSDTVVREVMTPRSDIVSVREDLGLEDVVEAFAHEGVSRLLVTGENLDDVRGVILAKDLMHYLGKNKREFELKKILRPPFLVPNSKKVDDLLQELKLKAVHLAIVLDEHGGVDGIVTIEDLIEEIVGEIFDEYDRPNEEMVIRRTKSGDFLVDGSMLIDDVNRRLQMNFPIGEYDTLAGFVIHFLGHIPRVGEVVDHGDLRLRVEELEQNRITLLRLINSKKHAAGQAAPEREPVSSVPEIEEKKLVNLKG